MKKNSMRAGACKIYLVTKITKNPFYFEKIIILCELVVTLDWVSSKYPVNYT